MIIYPPFFLSHISRLASHVATCRTEACGSNQPEFVDVTVDVASDDPFAVARALAFVCLGRES